MLLQNCSKELGMKRRGRLSEIATSLGVSSSTVSRAFRRPDLVRDETRAAIASAAEKAGYAPPSAAFLSAKLTNLALIVPDLENPFFTVLAKSVMNEFGRQDISLIVADTNEDPLAEGEIILGAARRAQGLIIASSRLTQAEIASFRNKASIVLINREVEGFPSVSIDHSSGMRQAVEHLAALGHTTIAYAEGPSWSWSNRQRLESFSAATNELGVGGVTIGPYPPRFEGGVQAADIAMARGVTAVVAYNDLMAFGVISRLRDRGVAVPEAMSVVGFDDVTAAAIWAPPLTTVTASTGGIGKTAAQFLVRLLDGRASSPLVHRVQSHLVVRASTGTRC
jgi:DNA-binding LacI/PurR family transcriptional regulator